MPQFKVTADNAEPMVIDLPGGSDDFKSVGIQYVTDDGREIPIVWVDNFYATFHDATVYLHLGDEDPKSLVHVDVEDDEVGPTESHDVGGEPWRRDQV